MKINFPKLPKIEYVNIRKTFPSVPEFQQGFYFQRFWAGDLIHLGYKHHHFAIDMRKGIVQDLMGKAKQ